MMTGYSRQSTERLTEEYLTLKGKHFCRCCGCPVIVMNNGLVFHDEKLSVRGQLEFCDIHNPPWYRALCDLFSLPVEEQTQPQQEPEVDCRCSCGLSIKGWGPEHPEANGVCSCFDDKY
jgi:hypothetical protein